jgi:hypothetical protein
MNYLKIYDKLCFVGKLERTCVEVFETHHIVPRCLGGTDSSENLTKLTPREHFIAHLPLTKIYKNNHKIMFAFNMMLLENENHKRHIPSSKYYEISRKNISQCMRENNPMKNEKNIEKMRNSRKRKFVEGLIKPNVPTINERKRISERMKGQNNPCKRYPETHNFKKGTFWWTDGILNIRSCASPGENFKRGITKKNMIKNIR